MHRYSKKGFFNVLMCKGKIAREERLERPTPGFGDQCSTD